MQPNAFKGPETFDLQIPRSSETVKYTWSNCIGLIEHV